MRPLQIEYEPRRGQRRWSERRCSVCSRTRLDDLASDGARLLEPYVGRAVLNAGRHVPRHRRRVHVPGASRPRRAERRPVAPPAGDAIPLVVRGVDLDDETTLDLIGVNFDDLTWHSKAGQVIVVLHATSTDPVADAFDVARTIALALPGAHVTGVDAQLVALGDIADRLGITSEAVRLWAAGKRRASILFPAPNGRVSTGRTVMKIWSWPDVLTWLRSEYRLDPEPDVTYLSDRDMHALAIKLDGLDLAAARADIAGVSSIPVIVALPPATTRPR